MLSTHRPRSAPSGDSRNPGTAAPNIFHSQGYLSASWDSTHAHSSASSLEGEITRTHVSGDSECTAPNPILGPTEDDPWSRKMLLTLDGGGVRGYSSLLLLRALMEKIEILEKQFDPRATHSAYPLDERLRTLVRVDTLQRNESPQRRQVPTSARYLPCHYFDYTAGTSTGGLIAIMLGRLAMTVEECIEAYEVLGHRVFARPRRFHIRKPPFIPRDKYSPLHLEKVIKEIVRQRSPLGHNSTAFRQHNQDMCRTIVIAWQKLDTGVRVPHLFRSYRHPKSTPENILERNPDSPNNYQIWQVGRATSAAPTYFKAMKLEEGDEKSEYIDGGFGANNPSEEVYRSVKQLSHNDPHAVRTLVSIGTGKNLEIEPNPSAGYKLYRSYANRARKWAAQSEATHERVYEATRGNTAYFRLNVEKGIGKMKLDEWKGAKGSKTIHRISMSTQEYISSASAQKLLDASASELVKVRQARSAWKPETGRWERFCHGVEYACCVDSCRQSEKRWERQDLQQHLEQCHPQDCATRSIETLLNEGLRNPLDNTP